MTIIYVTRYALTGGIKKVEAKIHGCGTMASFKEGSQGFTQYVHGKDFWLTEEDAKARANEMLAKKIASAEKNLEKLKKMSF